MAFVRAVAEHFGSYLSDGSAETLEWGVLSRIVTAETGAECLMSNRRHEATPRRALTANSSLQFARWQFAAPAMAKRSDDR